MNEEIRAQAFFCDDVRNEVGGKITVVGIYRSLMGLRQNDITMPKFVALLLVNYGAGAGDRMGRVRLLDRDQSVVDVPVPLSAQPSLSDVSRPDDRVDLSIPIELVGFQPRDGMALRVEFSVGDFLWQSEVLSVRTESLRTSDPS